MTTGTGSRPLVISDRAWHLRLVRVVKKDYQPRDLCSHFWIVVGCLFFLPLLGVGTLPWLPFIGVSKGWTALKSRVKLPAWPEKLAAGLAIVAAVAVALASLAVTIAGIVRLFLRYPVPASVVAVVLLLVIGLLVYRANRVVVGAAREPSLVMGYIRARKRRVCPLIEVRRT